jgi:hypothetical protein
MLRIIGESTGIIGRLSLPGGEVFYFVEGDDPTV